ncbi:MAG: HAD family hydrolase [Roseivivax sp.]|nr:HAD family hydrolase [Roseivivax sp.]
MITAILFDKDGTLFDFRATWDVWAGGVLRALAAGDQGRLAALAGSIRYDVDSGQFAPDSPVIAGTNHEVAMRLLPHLAGWAQPELEQYLSASAARAPLAPAVPLRPLMEQLIAMGLRLGVMTNDSEIGARAHLHSAAVLDLFDFVAGADSGFGAKPSPAPLLAFAEAVGAVPNQTVMVGDSTHDLKAGRAAQMMTVGVLTGLARGDELAPLADAVLPHIGHLPSWLAARLAA